MHIFFKKFKCISKENCYWNIYCIEYWLRMRYINLKISLKKIFLNIPFLFVNIIFLLILIGILYILYYNYKFNLFNPMNWTAITGIMQVIGTLIMLMTILLVLFPRKIRRVKMFLIFSPDKESTADNFIEVIISNTGNDTIILKKIEFWCGDWCFGRHYFIRDTYWLASSDIVTIRPEQTKIIYVCYNESRCNVGHTGTPYNQKEENYFVEIRLVDIEGYIYRYTTKYKANLFLDLIFEKINEISNS